MVGCLGSNSEKHSRTVSSKLPEGFELVICRLDCTNAGNEGVVISRIKVGNSRVSMKMRVNVIMHNLFVVGGSGLDNMPKRPRTHGRLFCKVSQPPTSTVALISTVADHLPWTVRSWSRVESKVRNLCTATEASDEVLALDVWVDDKRVLQLDKDAAMAGTCWGSCAVAVDEMRKLSARRVANSVAIGAMMIFFGFLGSYPTEPWQSRVDMFRCMTEKSSHVRALSWTVRDANGQGSASKSSMRAEYCRRAVTGVRSWPSSF